MFSTWIHAVLGGVAMNGFFVLNKYGAFEAYIYLYVS